MSQKKSDMSQKDYKLLIVGLLLKGENHLRGIANTLNTNQTTISRKILELKDMNIIDFKMLGKNKVFFLKKTFEAKQYSCIYEDYKLLEFIEKYPRLRMITERIRKEQDISLAIIFGSYAKQTANEESDIDLYIETEDLKLKSDVEMFDSKLSVKIGKFNKDSLLIKEIDKYHLIIKGTEDYYEKNRFFD